MDGERRRTIQNSAKQLSSWSPRKPHLQPSGTISKPTKCRMSYTISMDATKASGALCKMKYAALQVRASHGPNTPPLQAKEQIHDPTSAYPRCPGCNQIHIPHCEPRRSNSQTYADARPLNGPEGARARRRMLQAQAQSQAQYVERQSRHKPNTQNSFLFNSSSTILPPPLFPPNGSLFQQNGKTSAVPPLFPPNGSLILQNGKTSADMPLFPPNASLFQQNGTTSGALPLFSPKDYIFQQIGATIGAFRCDYPGCSAPPFQTQYLLNSHTNVHSQNRPHYCPVAGCPRSEGGKGFKRKNEMIRHGLVHLSPGYVCPFCPDREHKYPRPDNLQRHVRVHHVDKDKDDPQLRAVLAQSPKFGSSPTYYHTKQRPF